MRYDEELESVYTRADFNEGFRELTRLITGKVCFPWDYLATKPDEEVLQALESRRLPHSIEQEINAYKLWMADRVDELVSQKDQINNSAQVQAAANLDADTLAEIQRYSKSEVADKIRALIVRHSRHSAGG